MGYSVEVDFEVYKELTYRRRSEEVTYNDVIRGLLGLRQVPVPKPSALDPAGRPWVVDSVRFPHGTDFKAKYKGSLHHGEVQDGRLVVAGRAFDSPSAAAVHITGSAVNGWRFWSCKVPGSEDFVLIDRLRRH